MFISFVTSFRGEFAALTAALIWAIASVIYIGIGRQLSPLVLNLVKGMLAIGFLLITLLLREDWLPEVSGLSIALLTLSGVIGIEPIWDLYNGK